MSDSDSNRSAVAMLAGAGVVVLLLGGIYLLTQRTPASGPAAPKSLPFGEAERAYAAQIRFSNPQMSRAANMLNQEVTFIIGTIENAGARNVRKIEVTVEFHDLINQVILRETHLRLWRDVGSLPAGHKQEFQMNFENVPNDWNRQYPAIRVTGLELE